MGLDSPWLHSKVWRGEMYPLMAELRGMSMSEEELAEGGHPLALIVLSITLTKHSTGSPLSLTTGCMRPLMQGSVLLVGHVHPPSSGGRPSVQGWSSSPQGDALQGPSGCSVELAHSFASPSPCVAHGALFFQPLLSFFPFVCFLFVFFECPTLLTYDSTGV